MALLHFVRFFGSHVLVGVDDHVFLKICPAYRMQDPRIVRVASELLATVPHVPHVPKVGDLSRAS